MGEERNESQKQQMKPHSSLLAWMLKCIVVVEALILGIVPLTLVTHLSLKMFLQIIVTVALISISFLLLVDYLIDFYVGKEMEVSKQREREHIKKVSAENKRYFLNNISHEIRTPVNAMLGMDEMILRESRENAIRRYALEIRSSGRMLLALIDDILDSSMIEGGNLEVSPVEYDLTNVVNDVLNMNEFRAKEKNLSFEVHLDPSLPHLLYGDEIRIKQIMNNLLSNAVKYTQQGGIQYTLNFEKTDENHVNLLCSIKDTGIGIKKEDLEKLFQQFERIDEGRNRSLSGTGLGLNIVKKLLELMGGELSVESQYGGGSTFSFKVPQEVLKWNAIEEYHTDYESEASEENYKEIFRAPDAQVLIVDDTPMNITVIKSLLKTTKVKIDTAESGFECLKKVEKKKYDLIFLDHRMPEMDGVETLERMKELPKNQNSDTPVIALTANAISGARETYLEAGFADYLSKPVDGILLERTMIDFLPKEKVTFTQATEEDLQEESFEKIQCDNPLCEKLQSIKELNLKEAYEFCGSEEVFLNVITEYAHSYKKKAQDIETYWKNKDFKNYTVLVHALKSSSRLIGAKKLSEVAKWLEELGDKAVENDEVARKGIEANTQSLLDSYRSIGSRMKEILDSFEEKKDKAVMDKSEFLEAMTALREYAEAFDFDGADSIVSTLKDYELPGEYKEVFEEIKTLVSDVNQIGLMEKIKEMGLN